MPGNWIQGRKFHYDPDQMHGEEEEKGYNVAIRGEKCSEETGCSMVYRKAEMVPLVGGHKYLIDEVFPDHDDASADPDYIYESMYEEDPLEYDSGMSDSDEDEDEKILADEWIFEIEPTPPTFDTEFLPLSTPLGTRLSTRLSDGRSQGHVEGIIKPVIWNI
ncbi:hypothetical protein BDV12DRAFT_199665 [Aspergillus spectabilis]